MPFIITRLEKEPVPERFKYGIAGEHSLLSGFTLYRIGREAIGGMYLAVLLLTAIFNSLFIFVVLYSIIATASVVLTLIKGVKQRVVRRNE